MMVLVELLFGFVMLFVSVKGGALNDASPQI